MAGLRDTIKTTSSYFGLIGNSLSSTRKSFSSTNSTINNIKKNITNNTKIKKDLFLNSLAIRKQREEASKRKEMEDLLESSKVTSSATKAVEFVEKSNSPPFTRLLSALGYVTAGWIVENIPRWIFIGKEFVKRIDKISLSVYDLTSNILNISTSFNRLLQDSFVAIATFDFRQFTEGSVSNSFGELTKNLQDFGNKLSDAFSVFSVPLTQSLDGTQRAPGLGEERTQSLFPETPGPSSSSSGRLQLSQTQKQALDIIAGPESGGSYNAMNQGTINDKIVGSTLDSRSKIKKDLTSMTIGEVMERQAYLMNKKNPQISDYGVYAAGKYQIIPGTMITTVKQSGLSTSDMFSPENQDILGLTVLKSQGIGAWTSGGSRYSKAEVDIINRARQEEIRYSSASSSTSTPSSTSSPPSQTISVNPNKRYNEGDKIQNIGEVTSLFGMRIHPVTGTPRQHGGIDIGMPVGTYISCKLPCKVVESSTESGYGKYTDIIIPSLNIRLRLAHLSSQLITSGNVAPGQPFVRSGNTGEMTTGPHLHLEATRNMAGTSYGGDTSPDPYVDVLMYTSNPPTNFTAPTPPKPTANQITPQPSPSTPPKPTPAQVSPTASPAAQAQLTPPPERAAADLMIFTPAQDSAPPTAATAAATQLAPPNTISDFRLLNNFIKNKLLLDLAYL